MPEPITLGSSFAVSQATAADECLALAYPFVGLNHSVPVATSSLPLKLCDKPRLVQRALQSSCDRRKGASSQARDDAWCAGFYGNKSHWGGGDAGDGTQALDHRLSQRG
jgi:hypothetical protein